MAQATQTVKEQKHGCLGAWQTGELAAPLPFSARNILGMIGPGAVIMGGSVGSGEWLLGPAVTAQYGGTLLWLATIGILLQCALNTEAARYALYTGESTLTGYMRCRPGPHFWMIFYLLLDIPSMWPAYAGTSAIAAAAAYLGRLPNAQDRALVIRLACILLVSCVVLLMFGKKVYNTLQWAEYFMIVVTFAYLLYVGFFLVSAASWRRTLEGFFLSVGHIPEGVDWALVAGFASFAGGGGLTNITVSNYIRDKGWAMGRLVGAIPSLIGGREIKLHHVGTVFEPTPESLRHWNEWWKYLRIDQYAIWGVGNFLGSMLPALMTLEFVHLAAGQPVDSWQVAAFQAQGIAERGGSVYWGLTLLCGFWILYKCQLFTMDLIPRRWTDVLWSGSHVVQKLPPERVKLFYYGFLAVYLVWGFLSLQFVQPWIMILIASNTGGLVLAITSLHTVYVNRRFLPEPLRPPLWKELLVLLCAVYYFAIFLMMLSKTIGLL